MDAVMGGFTQMRDVKVKRDELLQIVRDNREKHIKEYREACDGYKELALAKIDEVTGSLKDRITELRDGQMISLMRIDFGLSVPVSHEKDYNQVIKMLEMSIDKELTIRSDEFACYVMDEWDWTENWKMSNSTYTATAARRR